MAGSVACGVQRHEHYMHLSRGNDDRDAECICSERGPVRPSIETSSATTIRDDAYELTAKWQAGACEQAPTLTLSRCRRTLLDCLGLPMPWVQAQWMCTSTQCHRFSDTSRQR